jgi:putative CocE/NonD family hydrolase
MSEGVFVDMRPISTQRSDPKQIDESTDTHDTVAWLVANVPGNSGKVGQWGISYPGFYTACGLVESHPALVAASPQAPVTDWFIGDDWHHNGAFFMTHAFNFLAAFGRPRPEPTTKATPQFEYATPDGYRFFQELGPLPMADYRVMKGEVGFWKELMAHGTYDDFWKARNVRQHLRGVRPAVMTVGGWFDAENLFGALECYRVIEQSSPGISNTLVMGPWSHGQWSRGDGAALGDVNFGSKTSEFYQQNIEFPFFEAHLKGRGTTDRPEAWVFETGRNQWRKFDAWPPRRSETRELFLRAGGMVAMSACGPDEQAFDEYVSDPARPVPFVGYTTNQMVKEYMTADQRFASTRPDVLVYETPVLEEDLTLAGPVEAELIVATSGTDSDWVVKLIDVYPDSTRTENETATGVKMGGYQQLVRGDVMRGKFRDSFETPMAFEPGMPTRVAFRMPDLYHTFRPGHRLMVQIQSSWFPLVDKNPQTFVDIYLAKDSNFRSARQQVFHAPGRESKLRVRVLPDEKGKPVSEKPATPE